ncbi:MAG TPA: DNA recombination protein RmuC, partial [Burkholderiaceae bacterium]|nr:DNA recombination protein RmuC [Burkholderiaceae bacterium]
MNAVPPNLLLGLALLAIGVLLGALVHWLATRGSAARAVEAALAQATLAQDAEVARTTSALNAKLAGLEERILHRDAEHTRLQQAFDELQQRQTALRDTLDDSSNEVAGLRERASRLPELERKLMEAAALLSAERAEVQRQSNSNVELTTRLEAEQGRTGANLALLNEARDTLSNQFKTLADEILETKSKRFAEQNIQSLGTLLDPLRQRLADFQTKVDDVYVKESKDRSALAEQVRQLMELNQRVGQEASNLVEALKGSSKVQGDYGEMLLERTLEFAGLVRDVHYVVQDSRTLEDGRRQRPDVVVKLPGERCLVIDSKFSLTAYERYTSCNTDEERRAALKAHIDSVRTHIRQLSEKDYTAAYQLKTLDFVVLFVPLEPAYSMVLANDHALIEDAYKRNVLVVTHSTLMFVVRTVTNLWMQEAQSRNAQEIARRGADLFDKLSAFAGDMETLGNRLRSAQDAYDDARKKLSSG